MLSPSLALAQPAVRYTFGRKAAYKDRPRRTLRCRCQSKKKQVPFDPFARPASDPFAQAQSRKPSDCTKPAEGFLSPSTSLGTLLQVPEADKILSRFQREQKIEKCPESGLGRNLPIEGSPSCVYPPLRAAVISLAAKSPTFTFGICAPTQAQGIQALKEWTASLGLPKGRLHGMDVKGVAVEMTGAVFVKYNSNTGNAEISSYFGAFTGVLASPMLPDGEFRQYGYLPLALFKDQ